MKPAPGARVLLSTPHSTQSQSQYQTWGRSTSVNTTQHTVAVSIPDLGPEYLDCQHHTAHGHGLNTRPGARVLLSTPHSTQSQSQYQTWGRSTSLNTTQRTVTASIPDLGPEYFSQHHTAHGHSLNTRPGAGVLLSTPHSARSQSQYQTRGQSTSVNTTQHTVTVSIPDLGPEYFCQHHTAHGPSLNTRHGAIILLSTAHHTRSQSQYQTWGYSTSVNTTQHTVPVSIPDPGSEYFSQHHTAHNHSLNTRPGARVLLSTPHNHGLNTRPGARVLLSAPHNHSLNTRHGPNKQNFAFYSCSLFFTNK